MNNNWSNADTIKNTIDNQECMIELNIVNDKIILIEDNECEVLDTKYINDKSNKICYRTLWSFLDSNTIENIMNIYYKDIMKNTILQIKPSISFNDYSYDLSRMIDEIYDCRYSHNDSRDEKIRKKKIQKEEEWVVVDYSMVDTTLRNKDGFMKNNRIMYDNRINTYNWKCRFITAKGEKCGKSSSDNIKLDKEYYSMLIGSGIECCGIHKNQYNKLNDRKKKNKITEIFGSIDMTMKNGVMCRSC
tara:strand:+ start:152 stop:889 length:738 start_codon:yes stop_codon:yes gene_type:complete